MAVWCLTTTLALTFPLPSLFRFPKFLSSSISTPPVSGIAYPPPLACSSSTTLSLCCKAAYNVQVIVDDDESEDRLLNRFRREVLRAGVLQECRRRRFFENKQEKVKRKAREASRRYRKWRPQPRTPEQNKQKSRNKKKDDDDEGDNWELPDVDIPYCGNSNAVTSR